MSGDIFGCYNWESTTGIQQVEARDVVKYSTVPPAPKEKNYPAQNVNSTEVAKPWFMGRKIEAIIF